MYTCYKCGCAIPPGQVQRRTVQTGEVNYPLSPLGIGIRQNVALCRRCDLATASEDYSPLYGVRTWLIILACSAAMFLMLVLAFYVKVRPR